MLFQCVHQARVWEAPLLTRSCRPTAEHNVTLRTWVAFYPDGHPGPSLTERVPTLSLRSIVCIASTVVAAAALGGCASSTGSTTTTTTVTGSATLPAFLAANGDISCELQNNPTDSTVVYCQTTTPPQTVAMQADGTLIKGTSIGNPGRNTPTLKSGDSTTSNGVTCVNGQDGNLWCTVSNGKGFTITNDLKITDAG